MKTFAFIFARGGSKGLPGKNLLKIGGMPLLAHSIMIAKDIDRISRIFVSTDDQEIAKVGIKCGAEVINRPSELAQDDSPEWKSWLHAIKWLEDRGEFFDCFVSLPTTAPLRKKIDVIKCLDLLDKQTDIVVTISESSRSPYFNMVKKDRNYIKLLIDSEKSYSRRQDAPQIYDMTTVAYVARPNFIKNNNNIFDGRVKASIVPKHRAIDIDDEIDFKMAELLMKIDWENADA
ncbi:acylneuraminate cytidylyltransferase family protein [Candidatus Thioglobus sp.]|nr:acylneuraminate cytidylyltransferase family protein [Candidatus Thioglobus sp.]